MTLKSRKKIMMFLIVFFISCMYLPSDRKNTLSGYEVKKRIQLASIEIDRKYYLNGLNKSLPVKSSHNYNYISPYILHREWVSLSLDLSSNKVYNRESVDACIEKIKSIPGIILGGVPAIITCDIKEVGFIELGGVGTGGKSAKKNELLLNLLALP